LEGHTIDMKKIAKYLKLVVLSGILLLSVGCTDSGEEGVNASESESVQNIRAVLQEKFDGPNEELGKIWDGISPEPFDKEQFKKYAKKLDEYYDENVIPLYFERADEGAIKGAALSHLNRAHSNGYELEVKDITIEESETTENSFNYTVEIAYTKDKSNDSKTINLRGLINTNEEGKIVKIRYHNQGELLDALRK